VQRPWSGNGSEVDAFVMSGKLMSTSGVLFHLPEVLFVPRELTRRYRREVLANRSTVPGDPLA
jgi:hypothetical protein